MLGSHDAKQGPYSKRKAESTGVEKKPRKVALKQKVPVPLKQTKMRVRPKSFQNDGWFVEPKLINI